ncbi:MAG TPA: hypothetical protein VGF38_03270 [Ktedonobacterales bacterium]
MDDWLGVFAIVIVCGGVGTLLMVVLRMMTWAESASEAEQHGPRLQSEDTPSHKAASGV